MQNNMTATKENIVASDQQEALLQRKIREVELIKEVSAQVNKTLDINLIACLLYTSDAADD